MQSLLILSLLITVWLNRDSAPRRDHSGGMFSAKSTGLRRSTGGAAHRFRRWVEETRDLSPVAHADSWALIPRLIYE